MLTDKGRLLLIVFCQRVELVIANKAIIEIEGKEAKEILKKGCPFNFGGLEKNQCLNSTYNGMSVTIDMLNDDPDKFRIFGLRSFGESLYHSITDASLEFGYIAK